MVKTQNQQNASKNKLKQKQGGTQETKISWFKKIFLASQLRPLLANGKTTRQAQTEE
jgi:hypothetical protein